MMNRERMRRGALAGQVAAVGLLALAGAAAPVGLKWQGPEQWALAPNAAHADSGRGGGSGSGSDGGGDDSGGRSGSDSDDSGSSGSGSSGSDDGGSGSGSGSSGGGSDDGDSGSGSDSDGGGDDSGSNSGSGSSGRGSDDGDSSGSRDDASGGGRGDADRPRAEVTLSDREVEAVMRGERVLVDDRGRVLEVEIEVEHGVRTVTVKPHGGDVARNPGPIGSVHAVDAASTATRRVSVDPRTGGLEVEIEHGVAVSKPHGGAAAAAGRDPVQVGGDLSPAEEAALIQGGWQ